MLLTLAYALLLYTAALVLVGGVYLKVRRYVRTPVPLKIPTTPAPTGRAGVWLRMARELILFESLFKASKWTWLFGWLFHCALLLVLLGHLRFFMQPVPGWVVSLQPFAGHAGPVMLAGLAGLWARRLFVDRLRYISALSDHLLLLLLMAIGGSGLAIRYFAPTDIVALKAFVLGLMHPPWQALPGDAALLLHLAAVALLMLVFPFSKLLHAPGLFFSPSRNQMDDARERRHAPAPWTAPVKDSQSPTSDAAD